MALNPALLLTLIVAAHLVANASAATYVVGDALGWNVPPNAATYANWASQHQFVVGDILVFNFTTGVHDVAHVSRASYDGCVSSSPFELVTLGPASLTLNSTGTRYYICTFGIHCSLGQKLAINVTTGVPSPPPLVPISPPTPAPTVPVSPPTPTPTPTPTPPSSSPSPTPSVPSPSPSPTMAPSPGPMSPSPTPNGSPSPLSPGSEPAPGSSPTAPGDLSPPPPPNSATIAGISTTFVIFASLAFGLAI